MEDLDSHAGVVANLHATPRNLKEGEYVHPAIVTASVDRIIMLGGLSELVDYEISGQTTWAGRSSMEISLDLVTLPERNLVLKASFTMVCRDPVTKKYSFPLHHSHFMRRLMNEAKYLGRCRLIP